MLSELLFSLAVCSTCYSADPSEESNISEKLKFFCLFFYQ